jgi:hypothetical protein
MQKSDLWELFIEDITGLKNQCRIKEAVIKWML